MMLWANVTPKKAQFMFTFSDRHDAVNNQECKAKTIANVQTTAPKAPHSFA